METKKYNYFVDIIKFIFSFIIVIYHSWMFNGTFGNGYFNYGFLAVDFYFITTGYLMMSSINNNNKYRKEDLGISTFTFIKGKVLKILPYLLLSYFLGGLFVYKKNFFSISILTSNSFINELIQLGSTGAGININTPTWYISTMIISLIVLYPLAKKFNNNYLYIIAPIFMIFLITLINTKQININYPQGITFFGYNGIYKAFIFIILGNFAFLFTQKIKKINVNVINRLFFTIIELIIYLSLIITFHYNIFGTTFVALLTILGVSITFSNKSYTYDLFNYKIFSKLGKFGIIMFLNNTFIRTFLLSVNSTKSYKSKLFIFILLVLFISLISYILVEYIPKLLKKIINKEKIKITLYRINNKLDNYVKKYGIKKIFICILLILIQFLFLFVIFKSRALNELINTNFYLYVLFICFNCFLIIFLSILKIINKGLMFLLSKPITLLYISIAQLLFIEILNPCSFFPISYIYVFFNIFIVYGINLFLYSIFCKFNLTISITTLLFCVLGIINYFYFSLRGEPFEITELTLIETAIGIIGEYEFTININIIFAFLQIIFTIFSLKKLCKCNSEKCSYKKRVSLIICSLSFLFIVGFYEKPILNMWEKHLSVKSYGYLYSSFVYADATFNVKTPEKYNSNEIKEILNKNNEIDISFKKSPNIIVIMNEAFSDLPTTYGFKTDVDIMPTYHNLNKNVQKGWLYVSTFGGGTSNTEFEFLTGNSMAYMPTSSVPYVQYIKDEQYSLAHYLKTFNYKTVSYHPYYAKGYNRDLIYPLIGFDESYFIEDDLKANQYIRWCLSDSSNYENLINLYENKETDENIFIFNITMQNHGGYIAKSDNVNVTVNVTDEKIQNDELEEYLSLINASDKALKKLINYFKKVEEDTIILFFGDHQPSLKNEVYLKFDRDFISKKDEINEIQKQSQIPFFIWANYDIEEKNNMLISTNYLSLLLLENTNIPLNNYQYFLKKLYKEYPVINKFGYYHNNKFYAWNENNKTNSKLLLTYQNLVHANMFDKENIPLEMWLNN